jgi:hypothetical protein
MQKWYQNKYVAAFAVAFATGAINALLTYVTHITDGLDWRHMTQDVGLSFLGPFMILVSVLPKITDILTPTIRLVSQERITATGSDHAPDTTITTHAAQTTVVVDPPAAVTPRPEQSSDHVAATVQRDAGGRFAGHRLAPPEEEP